MSELATRTPGVAATRGPRRAGRRTGLALLTWGLAGLALAIGGLLLIARPLASLGDLAAQRETAVGWLDLADRSLGDAVGATRGAAGSLAAARTSTESAAGLFRDLAGALSALSSASSISVFGTQPFGAAAAEMSRVAGRSTELAVEMGVMGSSLDTETARLGRLADDVDLLRMELRGVRALATAEAAAGLEDAARGLALFGVLVALWLALASAAAVVIGVELARRPR